MDKLDEITQEKSEEKKKRLLSRFREKFESGMAARAEDKRTLICELLIFGVGFVLSRCHLLFGARPLGLAFVAALPIGVWPALTGAVIGALSLGAGGIIFAATIAITVFLRAAISSGDKEKGLFSEATPLRMSIAVLCGFVAAVLEVLSSGLNEASMLFGVTMIIIPPLSTFIFCALFSSGIDLDTLLSGSAEIFDLSNRDRSEKYDVIFFQISALMLIFFISLSFAGVDILGISVSYLFSVVITLLVAKRFGALRGLAVGFASSLGISGTLSVAFALAGLAAGTVFSLGNGYALLAGGAALCAFSAYSAGLTGLLSALPEYIIGCAAALPFLKKTQVLPEPKAEEDSAERAEDMVGTMALAYQSSFLGSVDKLESSLGQVAETIKNGGGRGEEYEMISKLISAARLADNEAKTVDGSLTEALTATFCSCGFENGVIRAFGKRRKHFILAGEDESGNKITSPELRQGIEAAAGVRLGAPQYFRKGKMVLMECRAERKFKVSAATASMPRSDSEISGDTVALFGAGDDRFYSLLSDGMGSGELARETSEFVSSFLRGALEIGAGAETLMHMLNHTVKSRSEECSATVDLLEIDLLSAEATFIKSGAAPSFVKRDNSIFRIRSQTAPIGLLSSIDTERTRVELRGGDHIIMVSDGVADESDDAPWLLLLLGEAAPPDLREYADLILKEAAKNSKNPDDMSVIVLRVEEI